jgi:hypothetical protein
MMAEILRAAPHRRFVGAAITCIVAALYAGGADASTFTLSCKNQLREYTLSFDDRSQTLTWRSGGVQTDYLVHQVRNDPDRLQITGVTHDHGPSFLATFRPERQIAYSYPNKSQQTDACR